MTWSLTAVLLMLLTGFAPVHASAAAPPVSPGTRTTDAMSIASPAHAKAIHPVSTSSASPPPPPVTVASFLTPATCHSFPPFGCAAQPSAPATVPAATGPSSWLNLTPNPYPAVYPNPRSGEGLAYDPDTESTLMFGGSKDISDIYNDIWSVSA
ncbi:MAG: hypothetical protein L3K17_10255, partial [Thermoplasmata archaeon]|nr:hypothetical protein [Thermoplasmata archaeon]